LAEFQQGSTDPEANVYAEPLTSICLSCLPFIKLMALYRADGSLSRCWRRQLIAVKPAKTPKKPLILAGTIIAIRKVLVLLR
jgi:hypothetical protein